MGRPKGSKNKPKVAPISQPAVTPEEKLPTVEKVVEKVKDVLEKAKNFDLNVHTWRLLQEEPFFAAVSRHVTKIASDAVSTAGVTVDPKTAQFVLYYNPVFFAQLTDVQRGAVLAHEFYHLVLEHCTSRKPEGKHLAKLWNYATDLAINSFLADKLPEFCLLPGKGPFKDYPEKQASEWYFSKLQNDKQFQQQQGQGGEGQGEGEEGQGQGGEKDPQFDNHEGWGTGDQAKDSGEAQAAGELAKERLRDILKKATEEVVSKGNQWGTVSEELRKDILRRLNSTIDWKKVLRYFVRTSKRSDKVGTVRKINKRYPYVHPGRKVTRHANIAISIDQSGSVGDEMLVAFFSELNSLADIAEFTVIPFDSAVAVEKIFVWKRHQNKVWERVLCGGTDFNAPTQYVNEHSKFDGHIILTDLCAPKPGPSKVARLWVTTEECAAQPYFQTNEKIIAIRKKVLAR